MNDKLTCVNFCRAIESGTPAVRRRTLSAGHPSFSVLSLLPAAAQA